MLLVSCASHPTTLDRMDLYAWCALHPAGATFCAFSLPTRRVGTWKTRCSLAPGSEAVSIILARGASARGQGNWSGWAISVPTPHRTSDHNLGRGGLFFDIGSLWIKLNQEAAPLPLV